MQHNIPSDSETENLKVHWLGPQGAPSLSHWPCGRYSKRAGPQAYESPPTAPHNQGPQAATTWDQTRRRVKVLSHTSSTPRAQPPRQHRLPDSKSTSRASWDFQASTALGTGHCTLQVRVSGWSSPTGRRLSAGRARQQNQPPAWPWCRRQKVELTASQVLLPGSL